MSQEPVITLSIKELGDSPNSYYQFHVLLDKIPIITNECLSVQDSQAVREISRSFGSLFEQKGCRPEKDASAQRDLGARLFELWLASSWQKIAEFLPSGSSRLLVIASDASEILNLPWELLLPPGGRVSRN